MINVRVVSHYITDTKVVFVHHMEVGRESSHVQDCFCKCSARMKKRWKPLLELKDMEGFGNAE